MHSTVPMVAGAVALAAAFALAPTPAPDAAGFGAALADATDEEPTGGAAAPTRQRQRTAHSHRPRSAGGGRSGAFRLKVRNHVPGWARSQLRSIARCESKGDPRAVGGGGAYRGLYQFSFATWRVVGGRGDPVAASRYEQTWRAWLLLSRHGAGHWPVCA